MQSRQLLAGSESSALTSCRDDMLSASQLRRRPQSGNYLRVTPLTADDRFVSKQDRSRGARLGVLRDELQREFRLENPGSPDPWTHAAIFVRGGPPPTSQSHIEKNRRALGDAVLASLARAYGVPYEVLRDYLDRQESLANVMALASAAVGKRVSDTPAPVSRVSTPPAGTRKRDMPR